MQLTSDNNDLGKDILDDVSVKYLITDTNLRNPSKIFVYARFEPVALVQQRLVTEKTDDVLFCVSLI